MSKVYNALKSLRRDAAIEAAKITFAILGVGTTLADLSVMRVWLMVPAALLVAGTWGAIYRMCE